MTWPCAISGCPWGPWPSPGLAARVRPPAAGVTLGDPKWNATTGRPDSLSPRRTGGEGIEGKATPADGRSLARLGEPKSRFARNQAYLPPSLQAERRRSGPHREDRREQSVSTARFDRRKNFRILLAVGGGGRGFESIGKEFWPTQSVRMQPRFSEPPDADVSEVKPGIARRVRDSRWLLFSAFSVLVGLGLLALGNGGSKKKESAPDRITVDKAVVDLGKIRQGTTHTVSFHIRNPTSSAVSLALVWSSCDCTKVEVPAEALPPRAELDLPMTWRIAGHRGVCGSRVLLAATTTTGAVAQIVLRVQGDVVPDVGLTPKELGFTRGQPATKQIAVGPLLDDCNAESVSSPSGYIRAVLDTSRQIIHVSYDASADPGDSDWVTLEIKTSSKNEPTIHYTVRLADGDGGLDEQQRPGDEDWRVGARRVTPLEHLLMESSDATWEPSDSGSGRPLWQGCSGSRPTAAKPTTARPNVRTRSYAPVPVRLTAQFAPGTHTCNPATGPVWFTGSFFTGTQTITLRSGRQYASEGRRTAEMLRDLHMHL